MPVFDTPITTDSASLDRVLAQGLPVLLYLYNKMNPNLDNMLMQVAKHYVGDLLVVRVDVTANEAAYARFGYPKLPALFTIDDSEIESHAAGIRPSDIEDHVAFLMGEGPLPTATAAELEAQAAAGTAPIPVTDRSFAADVLRSDVPVLVDFWAPWCGPCHMVAPILDQLAAQYVGQVKIAKLNVDENPVSARHFQVTSIPMLLLFKDGAPVGQLIGVQPKPVIEQLIRRAL